MELFNKKKPFTQGTILVSRRQLWGRLKNYNRGILNKSCRIPEGTLVTVANSTLSGNRIEVYPFFEDLYNVNTFTFYVYGFRKAYPSEIRKYDKEYEEFEKEQIAIENEIDERRGYYDYYVE